VDREHAEDRLDRTGSAETVSRRTEASSSSVRQNRELD
jgi:hypothetical protein